MIHGGFWVNSLIISAEFVESVWLRIMLRNRSRAVTTSKQTRMGDQSSKTSPTQDCTIPISSYFNSPRLFRGFTTKVTESEAVMSPTSILGTRPIFNIGNPFWYDKFISKSPRTFLESKHPWENLDSRGIGLAFIGNQKPEDDSSGPIRRMIMFGSQLKVQIPPLPPSIFSPPTTSESPKSRADFGIKTPRNMKLGSSSPFGCPNSGVQTKESPQICTGCLPVTEMELSEDYTCVIKHGPNPRTTHIYDNCIVESCGGGGGSPGLKKEYSAFSYKPNPASESFLSFCYTCKKNLGQEKDIYIYRGDKAFCSPECRSQEMLLDQMQNSGVENDFRTFS